MKKIMIIGCCGSGKSTFAKKLASILSLELLHLDQYYWKANWTRPESDEWKKIVHELCQKESWIMDGNYNSTLELRAKSADTIIFLDYSTWICLSRVFFRMIKYKGKVRSDMPAGCEERFDLNFINYVWSFKKKMRGQIIYKLNRIQHTKIIILKNDREADRLLESWQNPKK